MSLLFINSLNSYVDQDGDFWTDEQLDQFMRWEREWRTETPYISLYEWSREVPESQKILKKKLATLKEKRDAHYQWFQETVIPSVDFTLHSALIEWNNKNLEDWNLVIDPIAKALRKRGKDFNIDEAKSVPIESIIDVPRSNKVRCLFHSDPNASMHIYRKDNRYHCFGCQANGSVIDIVMKLNNCSFIEAVKTLSAR